MYDRCAVINDLYRFALDLTDLDSMAATERFEAITDAYKSGRITFAAYVADMARVATALDENENGQFPA